MQSLALLRLLLQELEERAQAIMETDAPADDGTQLGGSAGLLSCASAEPLHEHAQRYAAQQAQQEEGATGERGVSDAEGDGGGRGRGGAAQTAGGRAAHMLPVVLSLVEAVVEALACDEAAEGGCLSGGHAQQVLAALERTVAEVVAFLEVVAELQQQRQQQVLGRRQGDTADAQDGVEAFWREQGVHAPQQQQQQQGVQAAFTRAAPHKPPSALQLVEGVRVPEAMQAQLPAQELVLACVRVVRDR